MIDRNEGRLELARSLGATEVETDIRALASEHPDGFDCVVDATGVAPVIQQGFDAVRRGGKLMTKEQHRDKESSAQSHRKKINGSPWCPVSGALFACWLRHRELSTALPVPQSGDKG